MGANRKLQNEIDRTLKKVQEGIEVFDEIWKKVYETDQIPLKEKYESDLKKEIKKLQRYRDQIKTWISGTDIKDKAPLIQARKDVEKEMERFKICEKETKTKTFSKEGLAQAQKQDPKERAKNEIKDWINATVDTLTSEAENFDAEVESLQTNKKRGKPPPRLAHAEEAAIRHRAHINRLEQILRLLDNEAIEPEAVGGSKEMVEDYLQRNEDDFDDFADPDDLYADLLEELDNLESQQPAAVSHIGKTSGLKDKETKEREKEREHQKSAALAMKMQLAQTGHHVSMNTDASPEKPPPPPAPRKVPEIRPPLPAPRQSINTSRQEGRDSTDLASESQASIPDSAPSTPGPHSLATIRQDPSTVGPPQVKEEIRQLQGTSAPLSAAPGGQLPGQNLGQSLGGQIPPPVAPPPPPPQNSFAAAASSSIPGPISAPLPPVTLPSNDAITPRSVDDRESEHLRDGQRSQPHSHRFSIGISSPQVASILNSPPRQPPPPPQPPQSSDLGISIGTSIGRPAADSESTSAFKDIGRQEEPIVNVPQSSTMAEMQETSIQHQIPPQFPPNGYSNTHLHLLSASAARFLPTSADRLWGPASLTKIMPNGIPSSYPDSKIAVLENSALFEKLETEALFFAFYYQPDTLQQFLAARELKQQSWRFHKQHGAWFQRHSEPLTATDEYEVGTYVYFDYNIVHDEDLSGWCYRLKQDFTFRYDALEDELSA